MSNNVWTVTGLNRFVKQQLETNVYLKNILIEGEISNFTMHSSGHWYFTLKDSGSQISGIMFASYAGRSPYVPRNGDKVIVRGSISVYAPSGRYQVNCVSMVPAGIGELYLKLQALKKKLNEQGFFDESHKKPLPPYPEKIAVVVGKETAAWQDIQRTIHRRWPVATILPFFSLVQGKEAGPELVASIKKADQAAADVLIIARGGGSLEDLWCFNEEEVVKAVYYCTTPVITGVGHESDTTLVDYAADLRASTPTAAAEHATPDMMDVLDILSDYRKRMENAAAEMINEPGLRLALAQQRLEAFASGIKEKLHQLKQDENRLCTAASRIHALQVQELDQKARRLTQSASSVSVTALRRTSEAKIALEQLTRGRQRIERMNLDARQKRLGEAAEVFIRMEKVQLEKTRKLLNAFDPQQVLMRGYTILTDQDGNTITSVSKTGIGQEVQVRMKDGSLKAEVTGKAEGPWKKRN